MMDRSGLRRSALRIGCETRGHQSDPARPCSVRGIDEARDVIEEDLVVRLHEDRSIGASAEDFAQSWKERSDVHHFLIQKDPAVSIETQNEIPLGRGCLS